MELVIKDEVHAYDIGFCLYSAPTAFTRFTTDELDLLIFS